MGTHHPRRNGYPGEQLFVDLVGPIPCYWHWANQINKQLFTWVSISPRMMGGISDLGFLYLGQAVSTCPDSCLRVVFHAGVIKSCLESLEGGIDAKVSRVWMRVTPCL